MTQPGEALLVCEEVGKSFGQLAAVKSLTFSVRPGEIFGIGGPNGAGKTTLFEVISGVSPATAGRVRFDGHDITGRAPHEICHLGLARVFQSNAAFDRLTALQNVLIGAVYGQRQRRLLPMSISRAARERAYDALEAVGLAGKAQEPVSRLPVLDRKLLMFASALATDPKLILLDEPVGGLNPQEIDRVMALVRQLAASGITIVLIEHVMRFMVRLSSRVMILHHGEKIFEGAPEALPHDPTVASVYLGEAAAQRLAKMVAEGGRA